MPDLSDSSPYDDGHALTDAVYRHAFPGEPDALLAQTRRHAVAERMGLGDAPSARDKAELLGTLRSLGFDRSMLDAVRNRGFAEITLIMHHAQEVLSGDISGGAYNHLFREEPPGLFPRRSQPARPKHMPGWGTGFARALAQADADLAAIDAAILAVTGREPPRGRDR
jgi:hypothetical protein